MPVEKRTYWLLLIPLLLGAFALRVHYLAHDRFHADEALYAGWALRILDDDPFLLDEPVDKPPLYLYLLAASMRLFGTSEVAARWPNLAASMVNVALLYRLARCLYDRRTGRWAAFFLACSPYAVLFARTAFTDPLLVTWTLAALNALTPATPIRSVDPVRSSRRSSHRGLQPLLSLLWAGLCAGLALATKQHALLLIPLILALAWIAHPHRSRRAGLLLRGTLPALLGFALPYALITWWDAQRWTIRPGFWQQSAQSYGGLHLAPVVEWGSRLLEWFGWARYLAGSPVLYLLLGLGSAALLARGWWQERHATAPGLHDWSVRLDRLWIGYGVAYLLAHTVLGFSTWDRYLLPLAPLASLLLARVVVVGHRWLRARDQAAGNPEHQGQPHVTRVRYGHSPLGQDRRIWDLELAPSRAHRGQSWLGSWHRYAAVAWTLLFCVAALLSGARAARNGYPVGGEHWAYQGLDEIVAYLEAHAPPDAVLYHHWLRWHYTYYLHDTGIELRYWQSSEHLLREVARTPGRVQYIVLPDWGVSELDVEGIELKSLYETRREDESVSLRLYELHYVTSP